MSEVRRSALEQIWSRRFALAWGTILAAACAVYFAGVGHEAIWYDEAISAAIAGHSVREILAFMPAENHPPLHFLILHVVRALFGDAEWALRLASVLAAVGLVGLGAGPVRRLLGERTAFAYAGVVLCLPAMLSYAHEARMYALATFAVTATALYGGLAVTTGRTRDYASFAIASLAAAYLHYYGLVAAALAQALVLAWVLLRRREHARRCLVAAALTVVGYLPWLAMVVSQTRRLNRTPFWVPPVSAQGILAAFLRPFAYREMAGESFPALRWWMIAAFVLAMVLVLVGLALMRRRRAQSALGFALLLLLVSLGTMAVTITASLVATPIFHSRYMLVCAGLLALLVSLGLAQLGGVTMAIALAALVLLNALTMKDVYTQHFNLPFRELLRGMGSEVRPGDLVVTSDSLTVGPSYYYFPQAVTFYAGNSLEGSRDELVQAMSPRVRYRDGLAGLLAHRQTLWHITDDPGLSRDIDEILVDTPGWQLAGDPRTFAAAPPYSIIGFTVAKYERTGQREPRPGYSTVKLHVTGLRPGGRLLVMLHDHFPLAPGRLPFRLRMLGVTTHELDATLSAVPDGDYVPMLYHDENGNFWPDAGEAVWLANQDKLDPKLGPAGFTFDALKVLLRGSERSFDVEMRYPPRGSR